MQGSHKPERVINLIDVSGIVYSRYYGIGDMKYGDLPVGAIFGFCNAALDLIDKFPDGPMVAIFDSPVKTFRSEMYKEYKANRKKSPEDLKVQWPYILEACECFGFYISKKEGMEADDIVASYAHQCSPLSDVNVISHDKDLLQLLEIPRVSYYNHHKKVFVAPDDVIKKYGVEAKNFVDYLALVGDSSDNVPGVHGVGPKMAAELVNKFGSVENILANLDSLPSGKKYDRMRYGIEAAILSKQLVSLRIDIEVQIYNDRQNPLGIRGFLEKFKMYELIRKVNRLGI